MDNISLAIKPEGHQKTYLPILLLIVIFAIGIAVVLLALNQSTRTKTNNLVTQETDSVISAVVEQPVEAKIKKLSCENQNLGIQLFYPVDWECISENINLSSYINIIKDDVIITIGTPAFGFNCTGICTDEYLVNNDDLIVSVYYQDNKVAAIMGGTGHSKKLPGVQVKIIGDALKYRKEIVDILLSLSVTTVTSSPVGVCNNPMVTVCKKEGETCYSYSQGVGGGDDCFAGLKCDGSGADHLTGYCI